MVDSFMGLSLSDSFFSAPKNSQNVNKDAVNFYFQQNFNKMLTDLTDSSNNDNSGGGEFDFGLGNNQSLFGNDSQSSNGGAEELLSASSSLQSIFEQGLGDIERLYQLNTYSALIGKEIEYMSASNGMKPGKGRVDKVVIRDNIPYLAINDEDVVLENVISIS